MERPSHIEQLLKSLAQFQPVVAAEQDARRLRFQSGRKVVVVLWPNQVGEVFFDFMQDTEVLKAESVEYYAAEDQVQQAEDIARVVRNFLLNEVRVAELGVLLKRTELQCNRGGMWMSVFESTAQ